MFLGNQGVDETFEEESLLRPAPEHEGYIPFLQDLRGFVKSWESRQDVNPFILWQASAAPRKPI